MPRMVRAQSPRPDARHASVYPKTFLIFAPLLGALYWNATQGGPRPLPLWPDSFILGSVGGAFACLIVWRWRHTGYVWGFFPRMARMIWAHYRTRRTR